MRTFRGIGVTAEIAPLTVPFTSSVHFGADGQLIGREGMLPPIPWYGRLP